KAGLPSGLRRRSRPRGRGSVARNTPSVPVAGGNHASSLFSVISSERSSPGGGNSKSSTAKPLVGLPNHGPIAGDAKPSCETGGSSGGIDQLTWTAFEAALARPRGSRTITRYVVPTAGFGSV